MSDHATLTGLNVHQPWHYIQDADPGAVGAGLTWFSKASSILKYRNDANTAWVQIVASSWAAPSIEILVPSSTTWTGFLAIFAAATAGSTIILANETLIQTSTFVLDKSMKILGHPGGASNIKALVDHSYGGSSMQMAVSPAALPLDVRLSGFKLEQDRAGVVRMNSIVVAGGLTSLEIDHLTFINNTGDCVMTYDDPPGLMRVHKLSMHDCVINEYYESVFNAHQGDIDLIEFYNNTATTSAPSPDGGTSRPYGFEVNMEFTGGICRQITCANNSFDASGVTNRSIMGDSLGISISQSAHTASVLFKDIVIKGNHIKGYYYGVHIVCLNSDGASPAQVVVMNNVIEQCDSYTIHIVAAIGGPTSYGHADDYIAILSNECISSETDVFIDPSTTVTVINQKNNYHLPYTPVTSYTETWTHANSSTLTADQVWSRTGSQGGTPVGGIVSNAIEVAGGPWEYFYARCEKLLTTTNHYAEADFKVSSIADINQCGVAVRYSSICLNGYFALLNFGANQVQLFKYLAGIATQLGSNVSYTLAANTFYRIRLSVTGSLLTVSVNSTPITGLINISDTTLSGDVKCGLFLYKKTTGTATSDNFAAAII